MTRLALTLAAILSATALSAQEAVDGNGDGVFTLEELQATWPALTAETFHDVDVDGNGTVDADELQAAVEQGLI
jgi:hypothetical protein